MFFLDLHVFLDEQGSALFLQVNEKHMCLFCEIVEGKVPSNKVYEDNKVFAFLDIAPVHPGHVLVVPKSHFENMEEIPENLLADVIKVAKKIGKSLKDNLGIPGYNLVMNNDPVSGQIIPHLHLHLIPRVKGDDLQLWPQGKYGDGEAEEIAKNIQVK